MKSIRKNPVGALLYDYGMITAGAVLYVFALKVFITPMQIPSGGIAGLALLCNYILGLPFGVVTIVMNVPLLLFGYKMLGRDFFFKTLYMTVLSSVLTDLAGFLPAYDGDILLAALFGGIIKGVGFGLVIRSGGTAGGSDVISKYIFRKRSIPIGTTNMTLNVCVLLMSAFFLKSIESLFYGIITQYVVSVVMDHIIYGSDVQKEAMIITSKPDESDEFIDKLHRIIRKNIPNTEFNVDAIASEMGLSRSAFYKKVKGLTGFAPIDLIKEFRLSHATELLQTTNLSIAEIAFRSGFADSSYFGKCFRKRYGMSPREYLQQES